ncbi:MAG: universal stress protein [Deltaproteobacteria bacterium]|nr:universal stress protein [Deltaproteobacteria bacterium]
MQITPLSLPMVLPNQAYIDGFIGQEDLEKIQKNIEEDLVNNYKERYAKKIEGEIEFETVTKSGRADKEILEFAEKEKVDLIVMGTHGRTGIEHVFFFFFAEKVLRHSPFPVFIIPDRKKVERY